ncbi:MAG: cofactor-independent phosphoglycerate mutase [Clostridia bacterium]|nr:cofactor-independent phosphoglycerate mutase [Clostridia bacterium]
MKYLVLLCDGAADYPLEEYGEKTPLALAHKPVTDMLASRSIAGTVSNVPKGMVPESDTANLAVMSYNPKEYSKGRSPLEAMSLGIDMQPDETAYRCNVVTLDVPEDNPDAEYEDLIMVDHGADEIPTEESDLLIKALQAELGNEFCHYYTGVSYRHCLIWRDAPEFKDFMRPHDILGQGIKKYLPGEPFLSIQKRSYEILKNHPVNLDRIRRGLRPANSAWFWSPGKKPALPSFEEKWGLKASVISAVDLIKGIAICAKMTSVNVEGATGNIHTNFAGKGEAAINEFKRGQDFVYIHVEAPDECGHRAEPDNKILSIEKIDAEILKPVYEYLLSTGEDFRILILPDHPTPIWCRTHTMEPVPFILYDSRQDNAGIKRFDEESAESTGLYVPKGELLMDLMLK